MIGVNKSEILRVLDVQAKKFGQNFLKDKNVLKIVHIAQIEDKNVIEIGAGKETWLNYLEINVSS